MKRTKNNLQYQETHERIMDALITLLQSVEPEKVTVTKICSMLDINRTTFYEHFTDVYDLIEKTEIKVSRESAGCLAGGLETSLKDAFVAFFRYVGEHRAFYSVYISHGRTIHLPEALLGEGIEERRRSAMRRRWGRESSWEYHMAFFQAGVTALLSSWIKGGCSETPEELYAILVEEYRPAGSP